MEPESDDQRSSTEEGQRDPSSGVIRTKDANAESASGSSSSKQTIAGPVKSACTFCRSRKSRCNGKQPCAACINRGRTDDCVYTISRRGGKPKPKGDKLEPLEAHLEKILGLSDLPHLVRIPNILPQLQPFHDQSNDFDFSRALGASHIGDGSNGSVTHMSHNPQAFAQPSAILSSPSSAVPQHAASLLSNSTFPSSATASTDQIGAPSAKSLIGDFYTYIFRFVPILPTAAHHDLVAASIQPGSPLILSIRCLVPILRNESLLAQTQVAATDESRKAAIRAEAQFYARQAYDAIDDVLERVDMQQDKEDASIVEVVQSLCLLVIYEYGSGRALKSRLKVDAALTLAMSRGLHRLSPTSRTLNADTKSSINGPPHYLSQIPEEEVYEMKKRVWWTLWMLAMWTAYNTGRIPTVRADDSRVTSDLPICAGASANWWSNVVSSLQALLLVQDRVLALAHLENGRVGMDGSAAALASGGTSFNSPASNTDRTPGARSEIPHTFSGQPSMLSREDILLSMLELDAAMQEQMIMLEQKTQGIVSGEVRSDPAEDDTQRILKFLWAIQVYTTSLTLHIGQAFQGATLFERKLCFLSSISEANDAAACQVPMPNAFDRNSGGTNQSAQTEPVAMAPGQDLYARGPFLPRDSLARCVDASDKLLAISRNLRRSEGHMASPNPFNACSFVLISFVCLMQALAISSSVTPENEWGSSNNGDSFTSTEQQQSQEYSQSSQATSTLLRSAQGAAALTPAALQPQQQSASSMMAASPQPVSRQGQLQHIWARVKEAKDALQGLSTYWDMVIPMREEVSGCLEASQFLLSQQPQISSTSSTSGFDANFLA